MNTTTIRQKLHKYIEIADDKKIQAIYTMIEDDLTDQVNWWEDDVFLATLNLISNNLKNGKDKGVVWSNLKNELSGDTKF
nr:hypothetical protein [Bacteroidota bacterium]